MGTGMGLLLNRTRGSVSRTTLPRVRGQSAGTHPAVPVTSSIQRGNFSTTTSRRISEKDINALRSEILVKEKKEEKNGFKKTTRQDGRKDSTRPARPAISSRVLEEELRWLKDPAQMGRRVLQMLNKKQLDKALALVQRAHQEGMGSLVAWNHILDFEMKNGRPDSAFKIYNDVSTLLSDYACVFYC